MLWNLHTKHFSWCMPTLLNITFGLTFERTCIIEGWFTCDHRLMARWECEYTVVIGEIWFRVEDHRLNDGCIDVIVYMNISQFKYISNLLVLFWITEQLKTSFLTLPKTFCLEIPNGIIPTWKKHWRDFKGNQENFNKIRIISLCFTHLIVSSPSEVSWEH